MASSRPAWSPHRSVAAFVFALSSSPAGLAQPSDGATETGPSGDAVATSADEAERPRVILLLRTPGDDDTMARLRFELHDYGWRILELRPDDRYETEPLATAAEREGATAAVRVDGSHGAVELWVRAPQGPVGETFTAPGERAPGQVLALRVAEALRARGLLVPPAPTRTVAEPPPAPPPPAPAPDEVPAPPPEHSTPVAVAPRLSLELGPGVALSPGGLAPLPVADLGARLELARIWSLSAVGAIPLATQRIGGAEGEAEVSTFIAGGLLELEWARFSFGGLRSGAGAGVSVSSMSGRARSGFGSSHELVSVFTPLVRTSLHAHLVSWLRLRAGLAGGVTLPMVRVAFGSREVASWGRPFVIASVALEASPIQ